MAALQTLLDTPTHKIQVPASAVINPKNYLRRISTQAFFRRLTPPERAALRGNSPAVRDAKEDLDRANVVELDDTVRTLLADSGLFTSARIAELMIKGEAAEGKLR